MSEKRLQGLRERMNRLHVREEDLEERFVRAGGPGGQNVNKVSTCVWLRHRPTGLEVKVQRERTQGANRLLARRLLIHRLEEMERQAKAAERKRIHLARRAKQRRPRRVQERILEEKRRRSLKKRLRARPKSEESG